MKKRLLVIAILALALVLAGAVPALAREWGGQRGGARGGRMAMTPLRSYYLLKHLKDRLQLTDEQLGKVKTLAFALEEKRMAMWTQNAKLGLDLKKLLDADQPNYTAIEQTINTRSANRAKYFVEWLKNRREMAKIFTPAQQAQLKEMRKAWLRKGWERRGGGKGPSAG
jgi:Spy/CpxP family protein refolding chaperone